MAVYVLIIVYHGVLDASVASYVSIPNGAANAILLCHVPALSALRQSLLAEEGFADHPSSSLASPYRRLGLLRVLDAMDT